MVDQGRGVPGRRGVGVAVLSAVAVAGLVLLLLFPASGIDRLPPECYSVFGYVVPCGVGLSLVLALAGAVAGGAVAYLAVRRGRR
jgi:hypothetical protein